MKDRHVELLTASTLTRLKVPAELNFSQLALPETKTGEAGRGERDQRSRNRVASNTSNISMVIH